MPFYDQVLRELVVAFGAALLFANGLALVRRRQDPDRRAGSQVVRNAKTKGASRVASTGRNAAGELVQAPIARTVAFAVLGLVMMLAGIASLTV